jgi:ribosomal protein S18 acetylase RimI-like enzyme
MKKFEIRILMPEDWLAYKSIRLAALIDSPDSFGSTYEREEQFPDAEWQSRLELTEGNENALPLVADYDGNAVGLAWGMVHETGIRVAHVYQMWVAPQAREKGIAKALLEHIIAWAEAGHCDLVVLSVTTINEAAVGLYLAMGFTPSGKVEPLREGSALQSQPMMKDLRDAAS